MGKEKKFRHELYVGITTWNSELFLEQALSSIRSTTDGLSISIGVVDNMSTDRSVEIARDYGAEIKIAHCSQAIALNDLLRYSTGARTLLMHSDVILLSNKWFQICNSYLKNGCSLVSPEDIGCGPLTRPYGADMPESCFLLFNTLNARKARTIKFRRRKGVPIPEMHLDLDHYYVTHHLPEVLARKGFSWKAMNVHPSPASTKRYYEPPFTPEYWSDDLSYLRYGMGNFYSLDNEITHFHNWYDRYPKDIEANSTETTEGNGNGLPLAFLSAGTKRFLEDFENDQIHLPTKSEVMQHKAPRVVSQNKPDLERKFSSQTD